MELSSGIKNRLEKIISNPSKAVINYGRKMYGVTDGVLLNMLHRVGIIKKADCTNAWVRVGWTGSTIRCRYIDKVLVTHVDGYEFSNHFVDGCFNPYLVVNKIGG